MRVALLRKTMDKSRWNAELEPIEFAAEIAVAAPPEVVFAFIADHQRLPAWVPGLRRVEVDNSLALTTGGVGTRRTLYPFVGLSGVEVIVDFEPPHRLAYRASDESLRGMLTQHLAEISCQPVAPGTHLRWVVRGVPARRWWQRVVARLVFNYALCTGLANLRRRFTK